MRDLYTRSLQSYCVGVKYNLGSYDWTKLNISSPDVRGGKITAGAELMVTIDNDLPTSGVVGLSNGQYENVVSLLVGTLNLDVAVCNTGQRNPHPGGHVATGREATVFECQLDDGDFVPAPRHGATTT
ncbi:hypothetical protein GC175_16450 [bacterium]|nr:hypothetical protein [bacterium]